MGCSGIGRVLNLLPTHFTMVAKEHIDTNYPSGLLNWQEGPSMCVCDFNCVETYFSAYSWTMFTLKTWLI